VTGGASSQPSIVSWIRVSTSRCSKGKSRETGSPDSRKARKTLEKVRGHRRWSRGSEACVRCSDAQASFKNKDLWIWLIEVPVGTEELFQLRERERSSDREVAEPCRGGGSALGGIRENLCL
jgi:hypothetical protein